MPRIPISERMNGVSKMAAVSADEYKELFLDADMLHPSRDNFYPESEIEELADNMLLVGHLEPILVGRVDGGDMILSGHRRYAAIKRNIARGHGEFKKVRCLVREMSYNMFMLTLISGNAFTRKMDDATLVRQEAEYKKWLQAAVENGEIQIEGDVRSYIAKAFGRSVTKIAQVDKINSSLVDEGKKALEEGRINFSKAYETSRLDDDELQRRVIQDENLLSGDVKKMVNKLKQEPSEQDPPEQKISFSVFPDEPESGSHADVPGLKKMVDMEILDELINYKKNFISHFEKSDLNNSDKLHMEKERIMLTALLLLKDKVMQSNDG